MKGNEGIQSQNEEKQRPQAQKLEKRLGHGADKFFVWDLGKTGRFWQLVGGTVRGRPPQEEMLLNMDHRPPAKSSGFRVCTFDVLGDSALRRLVLLAKRQAAPA